MITKAVKKLIGVEDAPKWLEDKVLKKMAEENIDVESAVNYLAPLILNIYRSNLAKFRPGKSSIKKASIFITAELIERWGYGVDFIQIFGEVMPAAVRGAGLYTPVIPIFDEKKRSLYMASKSRKHLYNVIQITTTKNIEGVLVDVVKIDKPPFYYLYTAADLGKMIDSSIPMASLTVSKKHRQLYNYWKFFRDRGYLVLVGKEIAGVRVELLAVGLGRYVVVSNGSRVGRLRKLVDGVYLI